MLKKIANRTHIYMAPEGLFKVKNIPVCGENKRSIMIACTYIYVCVRILLNHTSQTVKMICMLMGKL